MHTVKDFYSGDRVRAGKTGRQKDREGLCDKNRLFGVGQ